MTELAEIKAILEQAQSYPQSISSIEVFYERIGSAGVFDDAVVKPTGHN